MKKILPILLFFAGTAYHQEVQAQNRPPKPLEDNPTYLEGKNDMLIAATDFGNISHELNSKSQIKIYSRTIKQAHKVKLLNNLQGRTIIKNI